MVLLHFLLRNMVVVQCLMVYQCRTACASLLLKRKSMLRARKRQEILPPSLEVLRPYGDTDILERLCR